MLKSEALIDGNDGVDSTSKADRMLRGRELDLTLLALLLALLDERLTQFEGELACFEAAALLVELTSLNAISEP